MTLLRRTVPSLAVLVLAASGLHAQSTETDTTTTTVLEGVYTEEQAKRGAEAYLAICTGCHEDADFIDPVFHEAWADQPVYFLFKDIITLMPDDNPGILKREEVADVLAYILKLNGYPVGKKELPKEDDPLRKIVWKKPPGGGR